MSIIVFNRQPSWSFDASMRVPSTTPTYGDFVLSPVSLASRDQDGDLSMASKLVVLTSQRN